MAISFKGINQGLQIARKASLDEEQMDLTRAREERADKVFTRNEEAAALERMIKLQGLLGSSSGFDPLSLNSGGGGGTKKTAAGTKEHYIDILKGLEVDHEAIAKLYSTGGTAAAGTLALKKAVDILRPYREEQGSGNYMGGLSTSDAFSSMLSTAVITESKDIDLDEDWWAAQEIKFQTVFDQEDRDGFGSTMTIPGQVTFLDLPQSVKPTDPADQEKVRNMSRDFVKDQAEVELARLRKEQSNLIEIEKNESLSEKDIIARDWMVERTKKIFDAQTEIKDFEDYGQLNSIYGSEFAKQIIKTQGKNFNVSLLGSGFGTADRVPIFFSTEAEFAIIYGRGLVKPGDLVTYVREEDGQRIIREVPSR